MTAVLWLVWTAVASPFRLAVVALRWSRRGCLGLTRVFGPSRVAAFGVGVVAGLALAPTTGARFRAGVARMVTALRPNADTAEEVAGAVRHALAESARTAGLAGLEVSVVAGGRVTVVGRVPDDSTRSDVLKVVGAVRGVRAVHERLDVMSGGEVGGVGTE